MGVNSPVLSSLTESAELQTAVHYACKAMIILSALFYLTKILLNLEIRT